jgi:hypothetical protein
MFLLFTSMHFWVLGILRRWSAFAPTAYEVVSDCRMFEKHCDSIWSRPAVQLRRGSCLVFGLRREHYKMTVFWGVAACSLLQIDRRFRDAYCLHYQGDNGSKTLLKRRSISKRTVAYCLHHQGPDDAVRTSETSVNICLTTRQKTLIFLLAAARTWNLSLSPVFTIMPLYEEAYIY